MSTDLANFLSEFWLIFSFSFLVALTGAMSPGPLLTYTIIKSAGTNKRGYLMGLWIITGHAILEMVIIIFLLFGFSFVLKNIAVVRIIGVSGGIILILFGATIIRNLLKGNISTDFLNPQNEFKTDLGPTVKKGIDNPVFGGIMVSMSNPYWWVWWATIGFAFMIQFNVSFEKWPKLLAFFLGHEVGDLIWYLLVSTLAFFGLRHMNRKAYYGVLMTCALFMVIFGIYLGISPFLKNTMQ